MLIPRHQRPPQSMIFPVESWTLPLLSHPHCFGVLCKHYLLRNHWLAWCCRSISKNNKKKALLTKHVVLQNMRPSGMQKFFFAQEIGETHIFYYGIPFTLRSPQGVRALKLNQMNVLKKTRASPGCWCVCWCFGIINWYNNDCMVCAYMLKYCCHICDKTDIWMRDPWCKGWWLD